MSSRRAKARASPASSTTPKRRGRSRTSRSNGASKAAKRAAGTATARTSAASASSQRATRTRSSSAASGASRACKALDGVPAVFTFDKHQHYSEPEFDAAGVRRFRCLGCDQALSRPTLLHLGACPNLARNHAVKLNHQARLEAAAGAGYYGDNADAFQHFDVEGYLVNVCKRCGAWVRGRASTLRQHLAGASCKPGVLHIRAKPSLHFSQSPDGVIFCRFCDYRPRPPTEYYKALHLATCPGLPRDARDELDCAARRKAKRGLSPYKGAILKDFEVVGHFTYLCKSCGAVVSGTHARLNRHRDQKRCKSARAGQSAAEKRAGATARSRSGSAAAGSTARQRRKVGPSASVEPADPDSSSADETAGDWPPVRFNYHFLRVTMPRADFEAATRGSGAKAVTASDGNGDVRCATVACTVNTNRCCCDVQFNTAMLPAVCAAHSRPTLPVCCP